MIGPNVIQAIIDSSGNNWMGACFLSSLLGIWLLTERRPRRLPVPLCPLHHGVAGYLVCCGYSQGAERRRGVGGRHTRGEVR
jgi:hypothetical protein